MNGIGLRLASVEGGPLDGQRRSVRGAFLVVPSLPILKTIWTGENYVHDFTEHRYRLERGVYKYEGVR